MLVLEGKRERVSIAELCDDKAVRLKEVGQVHLSNVPVHVFEPKIRVCTILAPLFLTSAAVVREVTYSAF